MMKLFWRKKQNGDSQFDPLELSSTSKNRLNLTLRLAIVFTIVIIFFSFVELFHQSMELPPIGEKAPRTVRAPYNFVFVDEDRLSQEISRVEEDTHYVLDKSAIDTCEKKLDDALTWIETTRKATNKEREEALSSLQALFGSSFDIEELTAFKRATNSKNVKQDVVKLITPILESGIIEEKPPDISSIGLEHEDGVKQTPVTEIPDLLEARLSFIEKVKELYKLENNAAQFFEKLLLVTLNPTVIPRIRVVQKQLLPSGGVNSLVSFYHRGQIIIKKGQIITETDVLCIHSCLKQQQYKEFMYLISILLPFLGILTIFILYISRFYHIIFMVSQRYAILFLIFLLLIVVTKLLLFFTTVSPFAIPIGIIPLLTIYLIDKRVALLALLIAAIIITSVTEFNFYVFMYLFISGAITLLFVAYLKKLRQLVAASFTVGLLSVLVMSCMYVLSNKHFEMYDFSKLAAESFLGGAAWILSLGLLPMFEKLFGIATDFRLIEFNDLNHPILKQMLEKAPGTYHHSIAVGNLAGIAADAIGANAFLARVAGYFHDIGKLHKPDFFMENITGNVNLHANLSPMRSIAIIKDHVTKGVELAKKYGLPNEMINIIEEHHGTTMLESFYYKTMKDDLNKDIPPEFFRYTGRKPSSIEAAVVMIADSVEAISRVLTTISDSKADNIIQEVIKNKFQDGQFDDVPLTTKDITLITNALTQALLGIAHKRKAYPSFPKSNLP